MQRYIKIYLITLSLATGTSCKKFLQVPEPPNQLVSTSVFADDNGAIAAVTGIYSRMLELQGDCIGQFSLNLGLASDELINHSNEADKLQLYQNALTPQNGLVQSIWGSGYSGFYSFIYFANSAIEGLNASPAVSQTVKQTLIGESTFIRAFSLFYLVNLFGDIPLPMTTDHLINARLPRVPKAQVYEQIIADLKEAENFLPSDYANADGERTRPNKWAAAALLSRVYLYQEDWANAEVYATKMIDNSSMFQLTDVQNVFLANSSEAIWQLKPVSPGYNTWDGSLFVLETNPDNVSLNPDVVSEVDTTDARTNWIGTIDVSNTYYYPNKYKIKADNNVTEYLMVFRLAEQYLIRAEARAQQNNTDGAKDDLNAIRTRAGLASTSANDQASLLTAIAAERRVELFCEWGHRWFDLRRTGQADAVLGAQKATWTSTAAWFPIPGSEIRNDPNLTQNPGY
jgi:starch-binding outer membrane protein, SusD/RagB family